MNDDLVRIEAPPPAHEMRGRINDLYMEYEIVWKGLLRLNHEYTAKDSRESE